MIMERKIGEIFEYNGGWYQCAEGNGCENCAFKGRKCYLEGGSYDPIGECCYDRRGDNKDVIFKKLEKVGEPFFNYQCGKWMQTYKLFEYIDSFIDGYWFKIYFKEPTQYIDIEIKQNKDMGEKKIGISKRDFDYLGVVIRRDIVPLYTTHNELATDIMNLFTIVDDTKHSNSEKNGKDLKEFDLEAAKAGKPVCTRDGRKARIICFDAKGKMPIIALITNDKGDENLYRYHNSGSNFNFKGDSDLMMSPEKKEGWINVYALNTCYSSKEEAEANIDRDYEHEYVRTIKVNWEE